MDLYSGRLIIGRIFASEILGGLYSGRLIFGVALILSEFHGMLGGLEFAHSEHCRVTNPRGGQGGELEPRPLAMTYFILFYLFFALVSYFFFSPPTVNFICLVCVNKKKNKIKNK